MSNGKVNGKNLNIFFAEYIDFELNELFKQGETLKGESNTEQVGPDKYILKDERDHFDKLMRLKNYLVFEDVDKNEVYEIELPKNTELLGKTAVTVEKIYIKKSEATKFADIAKDLEISLGENFKFPAELYQLKSEYVNKNLPGKDKPAPEPKFYSETTEEYEERLQTYYGKTTTPDEENEFREPYDHEQINYREENKVNNGFTSDYYQKAKENHTRKVLEGASGTKPGGEKLNGKMIIKDSELNPEFSFRIGQILKIPTNFLKDGNTKRRLGYLLGGGLAFAALSSAVIANPGLLVIGGAVAVPGISAALAIKANKKWNIRGKLKKWINDFIYGPQIDDDEFEEPEEIIEEENEEYEIDVDSFILEMNEELDLYFRKYNELKIMTSDAEKISDKNSDEYKNLMEQIKTTREELDEIVSRIKVLKNNFQKQASTGGPKR